uniref:Uncharacterized protein n=1 Tax=Panagrellus redivivus TaxID=6233 RepID=A0A7E4V5N7_PANRE
MFLASLITWNAHTLQTKLYQNVFINMNAFSRVVSDLTHRKSSKCKYITPWDSDTKGNAVGFSSPVHDYSIRTSPSPAAVSPTDFASIDTSPIDMPKKLEQGSLDLSEVNDNRFLKPQVTPLKKVSTALRQRFSTDILRSKSLQRFDNEKEQKPTFDPLLNDCKETSSLSKIKKQARVIDVHVNPFARKQMDSKNLLHLEEVEHE